MRIAGLLLAALSLPAVAQAQQTLTLEITDFAIMPITGLTKHLDFDGRGDRPGLFQRFYITSDKIPMQIGDEITDDVVSPKYPVIQYAHDESGGDAIGSGYLYNGKLIPELRGKYPSSSSGTTRAILRMRTRDARMRGWRSIGAASSTFTARATA